LPSGYAPGQIKICIFLQATPKAFREYLPSGKYASQATPRALFQAFFRKLTLGYLLL
ncbi:hypothetical protein T06_260, partial [Trichinella sp. T6]